MRIGIIEPFINIVMGGSGFNTVFRQFKIKIDYYDCKRGGVESKFPSTVNGRAKRRTSRTSRGGKVSVCVSGSRPSKRAREIGKSRVASPAPSPARGVEWRAAAGEEGEKPELVDPDLRLRFGPLDTSLTPPN